MELYKKMVTFLRNKTQTISFSVFLLVMVNVLFQSCSSEKMDNVHNNYFIKKNSNANDFKSGYSQSLFVKDKKGALFLLVKYVSSEIYFNNERALLLSNINIQGKNYRRLILCNSNTIIANDITDELALKYIGNDKFGLIKEVLEIEKTKDNKILINYMGEGMNDDPVVEFFW